MNGKRLLLEIASLPLRILIVVYIYFKWSVKRWMGLRSKFDVRLSDGPQDIDHVELLVAVGPG